MPRIDRVRRAVVGLALGGTIAGGLLSPASSYLDRLAPLSGSVWNSAARSLPENVPNPYGSVRLSYDDHGVPHIDGDTEKSLYFAVGYVQAADRLFQLDLLRRVMRGELSEVVGGATLDSDRFNVSMDFQGAAEATWDHIQDTSVGPLLEAYAEGVNRQRTDTALPVEFSLLEYEPDPWTPVDSMLMEKQISWGLTGSFEPLRRATLRDALGPDVLPDLFPRRMDHDTPILGPSQVANGNQTDGVAADYAGLLNWVRPFERDPGVGSNSWVVSGEHTESGAPILANDPHLDLRAPPVWYQQHLSGPEASVKGVTFPGVPFVIIGENSHGAWGFTNVGADVIDHYRYETDGDQYRYGDGWRTFDTTKKTIEVADGPDEDVEVRKTVHGPVLEREGMEVGVTWTGLTATETTLAVYQMGRSEGIEDFDAATRRFDLPTQNVVYADRDGNTYYHVTGRIPIRYRGDGETAGDRIFDGSKPDNVWEGYTPYGQSTWEGFVPFEEKPGVWNPDLVATANQRVTDDPTHYIGTEYAPPFRGARIYQALESAIESGSITPGTMRDIQRDTVDRRAEMLVSQLGTIADQVTGAASTLIDRLLDWDYRMDPDSREALLFTRVLQAYRRELFEAEFDAAGLDSEYYPGDWAALTIDTQSNWFERGETPNSRADALISAVESAVATVGSGEDRVYGDINTVSINHPFDQQFLNYTRMPTGGSAATVNNFRRESSRGSSWRMVAPMDGGGSVILPGGNQGNPFGPHYEDQLRRWAEGRYLPFERNPEADPDAVFEEVDG